jgi:archaellum component FlaG (FlaF/FlaG flagellin family)
MRGSSMTRAPMTIESNVVVLRDQPPTHSAVLYNSYNAHNTVYINNTFVGGRYGIFCSAATENPVNVLLNGNIFYEQATPISCNLSQ